MSERNGYEHGVPCFVDIWHPDPDTAVRFYSELMGWKVEQTLSPGAPRQYFMCRLRGRDVAAIGSPPPEGTPIAWGTYVWVDNADEAAARVAEAGGSLVADPFDALDGGRIAIAADPKGAVLGLWQPGEHRGAQLVNEPGAWSMSFLTTPDPDGAKAFYRAALGWETEAFDGFELFRLPGYVGGEPQQPVSRDVIATMMPGEAPARWGVDFWIGDVDAAAETAVALGGSVVVPPSDAPVGRSAVLADPAGATFSISRVVPPA